MKTNRIRLTESQFHRVISESVKRILRENIDMIKDMISQLDAAIDEGDVETAKYYVDEITEYGFWDYIPSNIKNDYYQMMSLMQ